MRKLYFGILFCVYIQITYSQVDVSFTQLSNMTSKRAGMGYTYDGNYIYAISGIIDVSPYISTSMEIYDILNDEWSEYKTGLIPRRWGSAEYVASQNNIYIFNGVSYDGPTPIYNNSIEIVDVSTGNITYSLTNPYPVEYAGSAVWNDKIYIFGGSNNGVYSNRLYEFDPAILEWI